LLFRVAIREVEAWLLAHREAFAKFLGIAIELIPNDVDAIPNPKQFLINLARKSRKRSLRDAIVPAPNSTATIGKYYNPQLIQFVQQSWQIDSAQKNSPSLQRAMNAIMSFEPIWENSSP
jgi:hypothetical protein